MTTRVFLEAAVMHPPKSYHKHIEEPFDSKVSLSNKNLKLVSYLHPRHQISGLFRGLFRGTFCNFVANLRWHKPIKTETLTEKK